MFKKMHFLILVLMVSSCKVTEVKLPRQSNFPKTSESIADLPNAENLWIFILAGQSNMAGRGFVEAKDTLASKRITTLDQKNKWIAAKEPLHYYEPNLAGLDCGLSFAKELLKYVPDSVTIALIPCAVGGSSASQWLNDEVFRGVKLLTNLEQKTSIANQQGTIKGILWHQGESDSKPDLRPLYNNKIDSLFMQFRTIVGNNSLPIFTAELGQFNEKYQSMNKVIKAYSGKVANTYLVSSKNLKHKGDQVHFGSKALRTLGKRYAIKYKEVVLKD